MSHSNTGISAMAVTSRDPSGEKARTGLETGGVVMDRTWRPVAT